jgi:DNA-binding CsgD family transcriptional regulator
MKGRVSDNPAILSALIAVQSVCAAFFLWDVVEDIRPGGVASLTNLYLAVEASAALALISAILFELRYLFRLMQRKAHLETQVSVAAGAFHEMIHAHFDEWGLTAAESDVALFAIKGLSLSEIAGLRGSAEGTVKAQLGAVYRKAGVSGRSALLGLLVDDLLAGPLPVSDADTAA